MKWAVLAASIPAALAATPAPRWGQQAVYVESKSSVYVVGGETSASGTQITNDVLILPLNVTNPSFTYGPATSLPPHAFASMSLTSDESTIVVVGGMTSSCSSDGLTHTLDLGGDGSWTSATPSGTVRRRGSGMVWVDNGSTEGAIMVVGGLTDTYVCSTTTYAYPAADVLSLPMSTSSLVSSRNLPTSLTGSDLAVADFAMTSDASGNIYVAGGQTATGDLVSLAAIGLWTSANGWTSQPTTGDLPAPRVGASLVAHPGLDLLILHGGSTSDGSSDTATSLLAFLNTTTWTWSTPSNLQPPISSARSYHSSVMTPQGVMITAFGLAASGDPRSDVLYLDMRDPSGSAWTWKSYWNSNMLTSITTASVSGAVVTPSAPSASTTGSAEVVAANASAPSKKTITTIVIPIVVVLLILLPVIIYLVRRRLRLIKKRRMARHFSFSSQEDSGDFSRPLILGQKRTVNTDYPFGRDANEKEGNIMTDIGAGFVSIIKRYSGGHSSPSENSSKRSSKASKLSEKGKWEEIDFGLGKLDESKMDSRRSSFSATNSPEGHNLPFPMPVASTMTVPLIVNLNDTLSPRVGSPRHDGQLPLIPSLIVMPPTGTHTPNPGQNESSVYPAVIPYSSTQPQASQDGLDWNMLAQELETKPAFRSISPTSTLRSHSHPPTPTNRASSPTATLTPSTPITPPHHLPLLDFQRSSSVSPSGSITLINPKTGRRTSESFLPFTPRSPGQPVAGRQLTYGQDGRRVSMSYVDSGLTAPIISLSSERRSSEWNLAARRASGSSIGILRSPSQGRRASQQSRLRVTNPSEDDGDKSDSGLHGQAL